MKSPTAWFYSFTLSSLSAVLLVGCGPMPTPPNPQPKVIPQVSVPPASAVEPETNTDRQNTPDTDTDAGTNSDTEADPAAAPTQTLSGAQALLENFKLNDDQNFLSCAHSSLLSCQSQAATQVALTEKKADTCDSIMDDSAGSNCKNQLWSQLATLESNAELCDNISQDSQRQSCLSQALTAQALAEGNPATCDGVPEAFAQDNCKNQVLIAQAVATRDEALCADVQLYEYVIIYPEAEIQAETDDEGNPLPTTETPVAEPTTERQAVAEDQNYERTNCLDQVQNAIADEAAQQAFAAEVAALEAEAEAEAEAAANTEEPEEGGPTE